MTYRYDQYPGTLTDENGEPYPGCLIIERPDLKTRSIRLGEQFLTIIFWIFWFYLWNPAVSLLAWWFGFQTFYHQMFELGGMRGFLEQLNTFLLGIFLVSGAMALWSFYNYARYRKYTRRHQTLMTDLPGLAESFQINTEEHASAAAAKRVAIRFDDNNAITRLEILDSEQFHRDKSPYPTHYPLPTGDQPLSPTHHGSNAGGCTLTKSQDQVDLVSGL